MNTIQNKCFSFKIYKEGLRQLRAPGIVFLALGALNTLVILINLIGTQNGRYVYPVGYSYLGATSLMSLSPLVITVFSVMLPLLAFRFLNKRNASDFYHAAPARRTSLYLSFSAAALTWLLAGLLLYYGAALAIIPFFTPEEAEISTAVISWLIQTFGAVSTSVFIFGVAVLASVLSGNRLSGFAVLCTMILVPSLLHSAIGGAITSLAPIVSTSSGFLSSAYNPLSRSLSIYGQLMAYGLFGGGLLSSGYYSYLYGLTPTANIFMQDILPNIIFTAIGLAAIIGGLFVFKHRPAETAGAPAINRPIQAAFRLLFSMLFCIAPCVAIVQAMFIKDNADTGYYNSSISTIIIWYVFALLAYFVYELITTRTARRLLRIIPIIGVLIAMNAAAIGGLAGYRELLLSDTPSAEDISGVSFTNIGYYDNSVYENGWIDSSLFSKYLTNYEYKNGEIKKIVADSLEKSVQSVRDGKNVQYHSQNVWQMTLNLGARSIGRNIEISYSDAKKIISLAMEENSVWKKQATDLPPRDRVNFTLDANANIYMNLRYWESEADGLYAVLAEEIKEKDVYEWIQYTNNSYSSEHYNKSFGTEIHINISTMEFRGDDYDGFNVHFRLTDFLPKTMSYFLNAHNKNESIKLFMNPSNFDPETNPWALCINMVNTSNDSSVGFGYTGENNKRFVDALSALLADGTVPEVDVTKPFYILTSEITENHSPPRLITVFINTDKLPEFVFDY